MHGRVHRLRHEDPEGLFAGVPSGAARDADGRQLTVVRYHSLVVDAETFPKCLRATAWTDEEGGDGGARRRTNRRRTSTPIEEGA